MVTASSLPGPRRAAIALLSLDEELASQVLAKMSLTDVRRLCEAVEQLGDVQTELLTAVLGDLERGLSDPLAKARGIEAPNPEPLQQLRTARVNVLAQLLTDEHPQIAAVVLTQLPPRVASKVRALMEQPIAADLTSRISALEEIPEHAVTEASESLVRALEAVGGLASSDARAEFDGLAFSASIVNEMSSEQGDELLGVIAQRDEGIASKIREALFTFEDLLRIQGRELANVLRAVQAEALVPAKQTATQELKEHVLGSLSQRAGATLRDDMAAAPPKRLAEVEAAQKEIIEATLRLAGEGKITLPARGGEECATSRSRYSRCWPLPRPRGRSHRRS